MRVFFWRGVRLGLSSGVVVGLVLAASAACGGNDDGDDSGKVQVVTTLPLFADFVREVGGDRVEVTSLVPAGADPHTFEPSPSDVKKVAQADIAFANGLGLEPSATRLIEANLPDGAPFVKLGEEALKESTGASLGYSDPHLWMDPTLGREYARAVMISLNALDADHASTYKDNMTRYGEEFNSLRSILHEAIAAVPADRRKLVTTHDAFTHLADSLRDRDPVSGAVVEFEIVAVVVESPGQEPSPEDVANLTRAIEDQGVPAVFREPQIDAEGRILEQAAEDAGVQVCTLYSDSLDDKVTSYIEMMRFNADEIARCLGGESGG